MIGNFLTNPNFPELLKRVYSYNSQHTQMKINFSLKKNIMFMLMRLLHLRIFPKLQQVTGSSLT